MTSPTFRLSVYVHASPEKAHELTERLYEFVEDYGFDVLRAEAIPEPEEFGWDD